MNIRLEDHLCFKLYAASRLIIQAYGEALAGLGLTYAKYLVLLALDEKDEQTVNEIGRRLYLDSGTLSPLLKSLVKQGFITRERLESDTRVVMNSMTPAGKVALSGGRQIAVQLFKQTQLSKADFANLREDAQDFLNRCHHILTGEENSRSNYKLRTPIDRRQHVTN